MKTLSSHAGPSADLFPPPPAPRPTVRWWSRVRDDNRQLLRSWPVVHNLVVQELRVRYQRSVLGFFWTLLNPILMMTTMALFFSQFFGMSASDYAIYLFAGLVPWNFLNICLNDCAFCIILNEGLIRKIYLPKLIFPLAKLLINLATFVLSLGALFLLLGPLGARFTWPLVFLPVAILLFAVFVLGLGLIVATANTFFRDCGHLVSVFLQAWYFATPIIYKSSLLPEHLQRSLWLNPAYPFVKMFQDIIWSGRWPELATCLTAAGIAAVSLGVGYVVFKSYEDKLVFRL